MRLKINSGVLVDTVKLAKDLAACKHVKFTATDKLFFCSAGEYNDAGDVTRGIVDAMIEEPGSFVVSVSVLDSLRSLNRDEIADLSIESDGTMLTVQQGKLRFRFIQPATIANEDPRELFHELPHTISAPLLRELLAATAWVPSSQKEQLNFVRVEMLDDQIVASGTDGFRAIVAECPNEGTVRGRCQLTPNACRKVASSGFGGDGMIGIEVNGAFVLLSTPSMTIRLQQVVTDHGMIRPILAATVAKSPLKAEGSTKELVSSLKMTSVAAKGNKEAVSSNVHFQPANGKININIKAIPDPAKATNQMSLLGQTDIDSVIVGNWPDIGVNVDLVMQVLDKVDAERITILGSDQYSPLVFVSKGTVDISSLVMPLKLS